MQRILTGFGLTLLILAPAAFGQTPAIQTISPSSAVAGGPAFTITVNGSGFIANLFNSSVVQWNGFPLSSTNVTANQITASVPATMIASPGSATITVVNPGGAVSNGVTFTITASSGPTLSSLSPNSAAAGSPGFTMTLTGSNFQAGATADWNGSALSTGFVSVNQLSAFIPANLITSAGTANLTVVNPGGATSNTLVFTITGTSTLTLVSLSPNSATAGGNGFTLIVNGTGFVSGAVVEWNSTTALSTGFITANQLSAFVPANLIAVAGTASVTVMNPGGAVSNSITFTITSTSNPIISSLSPNSAVAGGGAFTLLVNGSNFQNGSVIEWNGSVLSTGYISASQLSAFVPAGLIASAGSAGVAVLNPGGALSNTFTFSISSPSTPVLSSLSPSSAVAGGPSFPLTAIGSGFAGGAFIVWNGAALTTTFTSSTQVSTTVPANLIASAGTATIAVINPTGGASNGLTFTITTSVTPTILSLSPASAIAGGAAFTLTVNGAGFLNGALVEWNGSPLSTGGNGNQLQAQVPSPLIASPGSATISVVNPGGATSNAINFPIVSYSSALRVAQVADGSNWKTLFQVVNLDQIAVTFSFQFFDDHGNPIQLPFTNGTGVFAGTLPVGGTAFAETTGNSLTLVQGWGEAASSGRIGVQAIFRQVVPGRPDAEGTATGIQSAGRVFLPYDNTNGFITGLAVANTNPSQSLFITLLFQTDTGSQSTGFLSLPPHSHQAFQLTSMFPALAATRGSIEFTASTPDIALVGLRFSPNNSFTSLTEFQ